ncbi:SDR family NAD(P)-dependent oxidoreductase [Intestinicryptomonas porci]|uniref:SDR family oxidoreductase n=1 Tax=Intestinicryptomonas porci TaxID=2926320 RepID=A0ABU4WG69_9BACT|nr:SDR family oxidoreductase [Opitutales bacterium CLA-KB-P66]
MGIKSKIMHLVSFLLHGESKPIYAQVSYLSPGNRLAGKKIIITGGGRGLGFAMAKKFAAEGAEVLIAGRNEQTLKDSAAMIGCRYLKLDVSTPSEFEPFIEKSEKILGGANVLVNNAGISLHERTFFDVTPETFDKQIDTNLKGAFFLTQVFIAHLKNRNTKGNVLFVSSETGDTMDFRPYGFTKAAVNSMVQGLAYLFRKEGIRINAVAPGITASDMTGIKAGGNLNAGEYAAGRFYLPEEVAEIAAFLVSDSSGCVSGQIITCNNAQTINARWK